MAAHSMSAASQLDSVTVAGKTFVAGLTWRPLRRARSYMAEARQIGKAEGMEMVAIRKAKAVTQAGFAPKTTGGKFKGKYSLAAALAGEIGDNWLGAFQVGPDRYAFVAVRGGGVIPGRDFIDNRDRVEDAMRQMYGVLGSDDENFKREGKIIAPADFNFGGEEIRLETLLSRKKLPRSYQLRPLTLGLTTKEISLGVVALAVIAGAAHFASLGYDKYRAGVAQREAAAAAAQAQSAEEMARATAAAGIVRPWTSQPHAAPFVQACEARVDALPIAMGGWVFQQAVCSPTNVTATYASTGTTDAGSFTSAAKAGLGVTPSVAGAGTQASGTFTLPLETKPAADDTLQPMDAVTARIEDAVRPLSDYASVTFATVPAVDPHIDGAPPAPTWRTTQFTLKSGIPLRELADSIDTGGLRIAQVTTTLDPGSATLTWSASGEIYGR